MSLGLGVFLGSLFLGTIILYIKTRDTWSWRTIWRRIWLGVLGISMLLALIIGATVGYRKWEQRPQVITSLEGISIGEKFSDVVFRHGEFKEDAPEEGQKSKSNRNVRYVNDDERVAVNVQGGQIESIIYFCNSEPEYTSVGGISCGSSGREISSRFDKDVRIQCRVTTDDASDKLARVYDVPNFGVRYILQKDKVIGFFVMKREVLAEATGINWQPCS